MRLLIVLLTILLWPSSASAALRDLSGVAVPRGEYRRIVSLAPSHTELLYAIGWGDRLVGVSDYCDYPAEARSKPRVGAQETLSVERVLALKPDLVLAVRSANPALKQLDRLLAAPVLVLESERVGSVAANAEALAELIGPEGKAFAARFRRDLAGIRASRRQPRTFYMVWDKPLMSAGPHTFLDDLIRRAGGRNLATLPGYAPFSEERLIAERPDVVLYPDNLNSAVLAMAKRHPDTRFIALPADEISRPGPRVTQALRRVVRIFESL